MPIASIFSDLWRGPPGPGTPKTYGYGVNPGLAVIGL